MEKQKTVPAILIIFFLLVYGIASADEKEKSADTTPDVVTEDIQAGIEKHIEDQTRLGNGYFTVPFEGKDLRLKLVKVHTEYLANLGPRSHFACVDLASSDGNVYDVDFFLEGDPGAMNVTETTVHKTNGQPHYLWEQKEDKTWRRAPVKDAPPGLLGVIHDKDEFEFIYRTMLPEIKGAARMWIPIPVTDSFQTVEVISIKAPDQRKMLKDSKYGNSVLLLDLTPENSGKTIELRYQVKRLEKGVYAEPAPAPGEYLNATNFIPVDNTFRSIAKDIIKNKKTDLVRARALYDHVIDRMSYIKNGPGWGKGDAVFACDARIGNCTDFHSYFIALSRASGIPARFAIGAPIPSSRNTGRISGYHCWAEFYADGKWWPVDISEADKYSSLATYYFGHHPANRVELSRGRDLVLKPGPESGAINFLAYPVLEINGNPVKAKVEFSFNRKTS